MWKISFCVAPYLALTVELMLMGVALRDAHHRRLAWFALLPFGLVAASKFVAFEYLGGEAFLPDLPTAIIYLWGWLESIVWVALPIGLMMAVLTIILRKLCRVRKWTGEGSVWFTFILAVLLSAYGMWEGVRIPPVVEREVVLADLPVEFDGYRIAHLSDLHCSTSVRRDKIAAIVERTNAAHADLIAITGDFVDGRPDQRALDLEPLKDLRANDGVVAATGNHERFWGFPNWEPYFQQWGIRVLRNEWTSIQRGKVSLVIAGMDDIALGAHPARTFAKAPNGFRILLYHRPTWCEANDKIHNVRLQLSGHTHGGVMPILDRFVALSNEGHVRGLYRIGKLTLHVSPGSGQWAGFPLRPFNPPEITILRLRNVRRP